MASVPVLGPSGLSGVITVFRAEHGAPERDELALVTVYAGYVASAIERDRLLDQVTTRNRVLETIREMLETLAGPVAVGEGLSIAIQSLRRGLQAHEVALITQPAGPACPLARLRRPGSAPTGRRPPRRCATSPRPRWPARRSTGWPGNCKAAAGPCAGGGVRGGRRSHRAAGHLARVPPTKEETALLEDAAHSLLAGAGTGGGAAYAHEEAAALRRSRELQRGFLSRLSHELRTPLTAIRGYAVQPDAARRDLGP